jgi:hypothetical protein
MLFVLFSQIVLSVLAFTPQRTLFLSCIVSSNTSYT